MEEEFDKTCEEIFDEFLPFIGEYFEAQRQTPHLTNPLVTIRMRSVHDLLRALHFDRSGSMEVTLGEPFPENGGITVTAPAFSFADTKTLACALTLCDGWEIFPRTDNRVTMHFSFKNALLPIR